MTDIKQHKCRTVNHKSTHWGSCIHDDILTGLQAHCVVGTAGTTTETSPGGKGAVPECSSGYGGFPKGMIKDYIYYIVNTNKSQCETFPRRVGVRATGR